VILAETDLLGSGVTERIRKRLHQIVLVVVFSALGASSHLLIHSRYRVGKPPILGLHGQNLDSEVLGLSRPCILLVELGFGEELPDFLW